VKVQIDASFFFSVLDPSRSPLFFLSCDPSTKKEVLTSKIGTGERLICGPNLVTNPVQRGKISSEDSAEMLAVGSLFPFGKGTVCADFAGSRGDVARTEGMNGWIIICTWALN
jgi:hypothetical protein